MIGNLLKKIIGDKNTKDQSTYQPFVESVNAVYPEIQSLTDNELRSQTNIFIQKIQEDKSSLEDQLAELKEEAENTGLSIQDKTAIFERVEKLEKEVDERIEETLLEILPQAFSVIKETAYRWANNGKLVVDAQDFDKDLAASKDGIIIEGDKAIWSNEWTAAGNHVKWNNGRNLRADPWYRPERRDRRAHSRDGRGAHRESSRLVVLRPGRPS